MYRFLLGASIAVSAAAAFAGCSGAGNTGASSVPGVAPVSSSALAALRPLVTGHSLLSLHRQHVGGAHVKSWLSPRAASGPAQLLYVSSGESNVVNVYDASETNQNPIGQLGGFNLPQGLYVDGRKNLWVTNTNQQTVVAYKRAGIFPFKTLVDPSGFPSDVCGQPSGSTLYTVDINGTSGYGQTVNVYAHGSTSPTSSMTDPNAVNLLFCAVDGHGNVFVSLNNSSDYSCTTCGEIDEFKHGQTTPTVLITGLYYPLGIAFDRYNSLVIADAYAYELYVYDPPYTIGPAESVGTYPALIAGVALNNSETNLWAADALDNYGIEYSYPALSQVTTTSTSELNEPLGVALSPPARP